MASTSGFVAFSERGPRRGWWGGSTLEGVRQTTDDTEWWREQAERAGDRVVVAQQRLGFEGVQAGLRHAATATEGSFAAVLVRTTKRMA